MSAANGRPGDTDGWLALPPHLQAYERARYRRGHQQDRDVRGEDTRDIRVPVSP